jgi:hypothetical protein
MAREEMQSIWADRVRAKRLYRDPVLENAERRPRKRFDAAWQVKQSKAKTESKRNDKYGRKEYLVGEKVSSRLRKVILENAERVLAGKPMEQKQEKSRSKSGW